MLVYTTSGTGSFPFELTDMNTAGKPLTLTVTNNTTGLKILKVDAETGKPLEGAGFRIKVKHGLGFDTLKFIEQSDGSFFPDENGSVMDLKVNNKGEVVVYGLPMGNVWIEEAIVPEGYFPTSAVRVEITKEHTSAKPFEVTIKNSRSVKLGLDNDWWEIPAMIGGGVLLLSGAAACVILRRRKMTGKGE